MFYPVCGTIQDIFHKHFTEITSTSSFHRHFVQTFCIENIIIGLYQAACECGHFQVPVPKTQEHNHVKDQHRPLSVLPPKDKYLEEAQPGQTLVIEDDSSLLAHSSINGPE